MYQKWPNKIFPIINFVFPHEFPMKGGSEEGYPPPMAYGHSNTSLPWAASGLSPQQQAHSAAHMDPVPLRLHWQTVHCRSRHCVAVHPMVLASHPGRGWPGQHTRTPQGKQPRAGTPRLFSPIKPTHFGIYTKTRLGICAQLQGLGLQVHNMTLLPRPPARPLPVGCHRQKGPRGTGLSRSLPQAATSWLPPVAVCRRRAVWHTQVLR